VKAATLHRSDFVQQNAANTKTNTLLPSGRPKRESGCPPVFEEVSEYLSRHQPQGTHVRTDVQTAQRTTSPESTWSHRCPNSKLKAVKSEENMQPSGR
jgi:hypothetical protein